MSGTLKASRMVPLKCYSGTTRVILSTYVKEGKTISFLEGELYVNGTPRGDSFEVTSYDGYTAVIDIEDANGGYISIKIDSENNTLIDRISHNVYTLKE